MMALSNLMKEADYKKIERLDSLLKNKPSDARLLVLKGRILHSKMADDVAVDVFKEAIKINPNHVRAYFWLAECLCYHLADWEEAEVIALQGLKLDPQSNDLIELLENIQENIEQWNVEVRSIEKGK